ARGVAERAFITDVGGLPRFAVRRDRDRKAEAVFLSASGAAAPEAVESSSKAIYPWFVRTCSATLLEVRAARRSRQLRSRGAPGAQGARRARLAALRSRPARGRERSRGGAVHPLRALSR